MKAAVLGSVIVALSLAGLAADKVSDNAKMYQADLEAMKGQESSKILAKLAEWKFELADDWMTETPASKDLAKHNTGKTMFSEKEIAGIFGLVFNEDKLINVRTWPKLESSNAVGGSWRIR